MTDRLAEIRARLDAHLDETLDASLVIESSWRFGEHAAADMAWLLDEVERLSARVRMYEEVKS